MFNTFQLFIGSNNNTHKLEIEKIERIMSSHFDGFTISQGTGYWQGSREHTAIVEISTDNDILPLIDELKQTLHQDAIAYRVLPALIFA